MSEYSGQDLVNGLKEARRALFASIEKWRKYGHALAVADRKYRKAYRKEVFRLKEENGVAWTAATEIARGEESQVADLRFERDVAQVYYSAELEQINALKIEIRILEHEAQEGLKGYGR